MPIKGADEWGASRAQTFGIAEISLKVAEVSNNIALVLAIPSATNARAAGYAARTTEMEQLAVQAASNVEVLEMRLVQAGIDGTAAERATLRFLLAESREALRVARNFLGR